MMIRHGILADDGVSLLAKFVTPVSVHSNAPIFSGDALSLRRYVHQRTAQRWEVEGNLEPLSSDANKLMVLFVRKGQSIPFKILMPQNYGVMKQMTATGNVTATGAVGHDSVILSGGSGFLPQGTFLRFDNHDKVYMLMTNINLPGPLSAEIYPQLRVNMSSNLVAYKEVTMEAYHDTGGVRGMRFEEGILMDMGSVRFVEKI
jgi:hypothetical protein